MSETWIVCRHVMDGSAGHVTLKSDNICLCSACAQDIEIINTEEVFIIDEERLKFTLQNFENVDGLENIDNARGMNDGIDSENRSGEERRTNRDRRSAGSSEYTGPERRSLKHRRREVDRRSTVRAESKIR